MCPSSEELLYLWDTGIFRSVWVAVWSENSFIYGTLVFFVLYGWLSGLQTRQPPIQNEKYQSRIDTEFLLMMGT